MFSKTKIANGSSLQELSRSGQQATFVYTPAGSKEPMLRVKASCAGEVISKLMNTGHLKWEDVHPYSDSAKDIKPIKGASVEKLRNLTDNNMSRNNLKNRTVKG